MLLSMTGYGEARQERDALAVTVEVRTVNSRYFKLSVRSGDGYNSLEPEIESIVRAQVRRGTVQVALKVQHFGAEGTYQLNEAVLDSYRHQLAQLQTRWRASDPLPLASILQLPGVVRDDSASAEQAEAAVPLVREVLNKALANVASMRAQEGAAMARDLESNCQSIVRDLDEIARRAPLVVEAYRGRLGERMQSVLEEYKVKLDPADLVREVGLFAERSDISEEIVRLRSHLDQFDEILKLSESSGRKLEFLTQEMFREANTIGSKANDVEIARHVIEIKTAIERMREMIQNVE